MVSTVQPVVFTSGVDVFFEPTWTPIRRVVMTVEAYVLEVSGALSHSNMITHHHCAGPCPLGAISGSYLCHRQVKS